MKRIYYIEPYKISEVFTLLEKWGNKAHILAGGTDTIIDIRSGRITPELIIKIDRVDELTDKVRFNKQGLLIGALATLNNITLDKGISKYFPSLTRAAASVGSKQIRNRATLAGNICNASPAADTVPALLIYDAIVNTISAKGCKQVPIDMFITGPRKTVLKNNELVESIFIPYKQFKYGSSYLRLARREGVDLAMLCIGSLISENGDVSIALGAVGPRAFRAYETESLLKGKAFEKKNVDSVMDTLVNETSPITDLRASKEYRQEMVVRLGKRAILEAKYALVKNGGKYCGV